MSGQPPNQEMWGAVLGGKGEVPLGPRMLKRFRSFNRLMPAEPRCKLCLLPFGGAGGFVARRLLGRRPSRRNPNFCNSCELLMEAFPGGTEIELTLLFADVRGSTTMAEGMSPTQFSQLMNRFYGIANEILIKSDAFIDKLVGDEVVALYFPGFAGNGHARKAIFAARALAEAIALGQPPLPLGVGVHTGVAYVGTVGSKDSFNDVTALGDAVNVTARLASQAGPGEVLVSEEAYGAAGAPFGDLEVRQLQLKGKSKPFAVLVLLPGRG